MSAEVYWHHIAIGLQVRQNPAVRRSAALVSSGSIGQPLNARMVAPAHRPCDQVRRPWRLGGGNHDPPPPRPRQPRACCSSPRTCPFRMRAGCGKRVSTAHSSRLFSS